MIFKRCANLWTFLAVFCLCYFLETITFTYLITAVTSVERQFHIPSRQSGTLIAASDIGYVLTVVFLSYFGSKGNRAKWIGGGCMLISVACLIGSLPGLIFPARDRAFDYSFVVNALTPGGLAPIDPLIRSPVIGRSDYTSTSLISKQEASHLLKLAKLPFAVCDPRIQAIRAHVKQEYCVDKSAASGSHRLGYWIVFGSVALIGVGHSMPWTLGMPLIDDNVSKKNTPFFFAGVFFIRIMGPVLGFTIGGWANKLYVTLKPPTGLQPTDPGWIGAWWLGFLIVSAGLFLPSLILFCFPNIDFSRFKKEKAAKMSKNGTTTNTKTTTTRINNRLKKNGAAEPAKFTKNITAATTTSTTNDTAAERENFTVADATTRSNKIVPEKTKFVEKSLTAEFGNFVSSLCKCLQSPIYLGCLFGRMFDAFAFKGFFVFQPKYLEHHYGVAQYKANFYMALMGIIGFAMGVLIGSVLMRKFKLEGRKVAVYIGVLSLVSSCLSFSLIALRCDSVNNQVSVDGRSKKFNFQASCNADCACLNQNLFPVCDSTGKAYFSPCHAGCRMISMTEPDKPFNFNMSDCSCVANSGSVSKSFCKDDCDRTFMFYIIISVLSGVVAGSQVIPGILILFRSVSTDIRSVALGVLGFMVSLFSTFPSPIVFGSIIDTTCMLWESTCGSRGACLLYDSKLLRVRIHVFQAILRAAASLFDVWVWYYAKGMKLMEEVDVVAEKTANENQTDDDDDDDDYTSEEIMRNLEENNNLLLDDATAQKQLNSNSNRSRSGSSTKKMSAGEENIEIEPGAKFRRGSNVSASAASGERRKSTALQMIEQFGSLYELEMKSQGRENVAE